MLSGSWSAEAFVRRGRHKTVAQIVKAMVIDIMIWFFSEKFTPKQHFYPLFQRAHKCTSSIRK